MALAIPALALSYLLTSNPAKTAAEKQVKDALDLRDGREKMPKKMGRSTVGDPIYRQAVKRMNPFISQPPTSDQRRGVVINRPVPLKDQVARQNLLFEVRRSGGAGGGGLGNYALLRDKYTNARALHMNRRTRIQPGLSVVDVAYMDPEPPIVYDDVGTTAVPTREEINALVMQQPQSHARVYA
jgi:hypothetical protein